MKLNGSAFYETADVYKKLTIECYNTHILKFILNKTLIFQTIVITLCVDGVTYALKSKDGFNHIMVLSFSFS